MIILKELKLDYVKNNYKIIKEITKEISLIEIDNQKYILKKIIFIINYKTLKKQNNYIKYLNKNNIKVANILFSYKDGNNLYEIQEYIENNNTKINTNSLIQTIAKYHNVSIKYSDDLLKNNIYDQKFICNGLEINKLLLGFNEKYYIYPKKNLFDNYHLIKKENLQYMNELLTIYDNSYNTFIKKYNKQQLIIHNDITSNNVINYNNELYLIDFDLAIRSSPYVDFIDCAIKRYKTIYQLSNRLSNIKSEIKKYIEVYNKNNDIIKLDYKGALYMLILKLISYNLYVSLNNENVNNFNDNLPKLLKIIKKLYVEVI